MDDLKKIFPLSYKYIQNVERLITGIIIYLVIGIIGGVFVYLGSLIPYVDFIFWALGTLLDLYVVGGIVILILVYTKVIKQ